MVSRLIALAVLSAAAWAQAPRIAGCEVFPESNIWNTRVDHLPVDANSAKYVETIGVSLPLVPDFGSGLFQGGPIGIPFVVVPGTQSRVNLTFEYAGESEPGPYPIPPDAPVEGGENSRGDRHVLVLDRDNCLLYEVFSAYPQMDGSWRAGSGAIFDLKSHGLRPRGWTSGDAAGLPIVPGLVRWEEVEAGEIRHAIRMTVPRTQRAYVWPGRHFASRLTEDRFPPMGQRFRLKADFDIGGFSPVTKAILQALKKYGSILADNGSAWFISGAPHENWNNTVLRELRRVRGADFEAVNQAPLTVIEDSGEAKQLPARIRHDATGEATALSPGLVFTVEGEGIGAEVEEEVPLLEDGSPRTEWRGIRVLVGESAAGLIAVRPGGVRAVTGDVVGERVVVESGGAAVLEEVVLVLEAAPGLYPGVMNEDESVNSEQQRAEKGSVVTVRGTGFSSAVEARIGRVPAEVVAVRSNGGVVEVKLRVPLEAASGEVTLWLGSRGYSTDPRSVWAR